MTRLSHSNYDALLKCIGFIHSHMDSESLPAHIFSAVSKIISSSVVAHAKFVQRGKKILLLEPSSNAEITAVEGFVRNMHEHPFLSMLYGEVFKKTHPFKDDVVRVAQRRFKHYSQSSAIKISDVFTHKQFHKLPLYNEFFRLNNFEYQLGTPILQGYLFHTALTFNRDRIDFSEEERLILNILRPHIIQAFKNAEAVSTLRQNLKKSAKARNIEIGNLTLRQHEVLYWLTQGKSNVEIGIILNISLDTVKKHVEQIYQKLGVENRVAAARVIMEKSEDV